MAKHWETQQHDNGNLICTNGPELVYIEIDPENGKLTYYRKFNIEDYKSFLEPEEILDNELENLSNLVDYLMDGNEWSEHGYDINIISLLESIF